MPPAATGNLPVAPRPYWQEGSPRHNQDYQKYSPYPLQVYALYTKIPLIQSRCLYHQRVPGCKACI